jgi:hypothetical protein
VSVLGRLATALGRNDERPNVELAEEIAAKGDRAAVTELVGALTAGTTAVQNDALKALYETAYRNPALVAPHIAAFTGLLSSRNNRNVWGALQAIETLTPGQPGPVLAALPAILAAADKGSVIAKDKAVGILCALAAAGHGPKAVPVALQRLDTAAPNQFPMYAEQIAAVVDAPAQKRLAALIEKRLPEMASTAKAARLEKLLRKLAKSSSAGR